MDIRFFNTFNHAAAILDHLLPEINSRGVKSVAYISQSKYRKTNRGDDHIEFFEKSSLTSISKSRKRFNQVVYAISASLKILFSPAKFHIFFTQPPLYPIIGAWLSRLRGVPYAIHIMDHYPGLVGALGYLDMGGWLYKLLDKKMDKALIKAEFVVVLGSCMEKMVVDKGVDPQKVKIVINAPKVKDEPLTVDYFAKIGLSDKFTIIYAGNMGVAHEFRSVLKVSARLEETHPDIHFIMLGKGHRKKEVQGFYDEHKPKNMTMVGYLENEEFTAIMKQTDIHLITLRDNFNGLMVPSKLYSSLALGKPVIFEGPERNEITDVLTTYDAGVRVGHLDDGALERSILEYYSDTNKVKEQGLNAKRYFEEQGKASAFIGDYAEYIIKKSAIS